MAETIDLGLEYRGGVAAPTTEQIGNTPRASATHVLSYPAEQQTLAGSGAWDGAARSIAVGGSGARTVTLANGSFIGQTVEVFDLNGNASGGTITVDPDGATTINGSATSTLTTDYQAKRFRYVAASAWVRMT
jgi:hypothetical protein